MATVYSNLFSSAGVAINPPRAPHSGVFARKAVYAAAATGDGTAAADIIQMIPVAKGTTVLQVILTSEDLDSNVSPTTELDVGDGGDVDRFIDGSAIATTGGVATIGSGVAAAAQDAVFYTYTADDTIDIKVVTAGSTKVAGNITLVALMTMED